MGSPGLKAATDNYKDYNCQLTQQPAVDGKWAVLLALTPMCPLMCACQSQQVGSDGITSALLQPLLAPGDEGTNT